MVVMGQLASAGQKKRRAGEAADEAPVALEERGGDEAEALEDDEGLEVCFCCACMRACCQEHVRARVEQPHECLCTSANTKRLPSFCAQQHALSRVGCSVLDCCVLCKRVGLPHAHRKHDSPAPSTRPAIVPQRAQPSRARAALDVAGM